MSEMNTIEEILADLRAGKPVVIMDDEDRENEGDVICAAEFATTENVNFMAKFARGLICMPMDPSYSDRYNLPQMCIVNTDNHCTAFSVSVDHISTTTGISAEERGITARAFASPDTKGDPDTCFHWRRSREGSLRETAIQKQPWIFADLQGFSR